MFRTPVRIAVLGSSGTYGYRVRPADAWPCVLGSLLAEAGWDVTLRNFATMGLPLEAYFERVLHIQETFTPNAYVFQLPTVGRAYFGLNGSGRIDESGFNAAEVFGWRSDDDTSPRPSPTRLQWTQGMAAEASEFFPLIKRYFYPRCRQNNPEETYESVLAFLKFWDENVSDSNVRHVQHGKEILLLQKAVTQFECKYCMFDWIGYNCRKDSRLGAVREFIDFRAFLGNGEQTAFEFLAGAYGGQDDAYRLDDQGHLTPEGHRRLAEGFVFPGVSQMLLSGTPGSGS